MKKHDSWINSYETGVAKKYGLIPAILFEHVKRFCNYHDHKEGKEYWHSQAEIADVLCVDRGSINKAKNTLEEAGLIKTKIGYKPGTHEKTTFWSIYDNSSCISDENPHQGVSETAKFGVSETTKQSERGNFSNEKDDSNEKDEISSFRKGKFHLSSLNNKDINNKDKQKVIFSDFSENSILKKTNQKSVTEQFFQDFPNSQEIEIVAMHLNTPKNDLIAVLSDFRKVMEIEYQNMNKFATHFKNWFKKRQESQKQIQQAQLPTKRRNQF